MDKCGKFPDTNNHFTRITYDVFFTEFDVKSILRISYNEARIWQSFQIYKVVCLQYNRPNKTVTRDFFREILIGVIKSLVNSRASNFFRVRITPSKVTSEVLEHCTTLTKHR